MQNPYILTEDTFTVFVNGEPFATDRTNPGWEQIKQEINKVEANTERLIALVRPDTVIEESVADVQEVPSETVPYTTVRKESTITSQREC